MMRKKIGYSRSLWPNSYLALDVYFAVCRSTQTLEMSSGFADLHTKLAIFRFDNVLCTMGLEKVTACLIVLKAELISEET